MATVLIAVLPVLSITMSTSTAVTVVVVSIWSLLILLLISLFWILAFWYWDRMSMRLRSGALVWSLSILLGMMCLPLLLSISGGCCSFAGHGESVNQIHHMWLPCVIHVAMLVAAGMNIGLLQWHVWRSKGPPSNPTKLLIHGYLCLYAVLCQVAFFPINFHIM